MRRLFLVAFSIGLLALCTTVTSALEFSSATHANFYDPLPSESLHTRAKRAVFAALGIASQCEPGWTGQFCENPICSEHAELYPASTASYLIDFLVLSGGCGGKYFVPVDSSVTTLRVEISSAGVAYVNISDAGGNLVSPTISLNSESYSVVTYDGIAPGSYQMTVDNGNTPGTCYANVMGTTNMTVDQVFVNNPQTDDAPNGESATDGVPMYFASHVNNFYQPGQVNSVTIRLQKDMDVLYRSTLTRRYGCAYDYYAGQFICDQSHRYVYHIDGIDSNGYPFRRSDMFSCMAPLPTTPAPTTEPKPFECYNGGTLLKQGSANATCFCPELFDGNQCQYANCMNGGIRNDVNNGQDCVCLDGWQGTNCQTMECYDNDGPSLTDSKTLVVVIRDTASMSSYVQSIINAIQDEVEKNEMYPDDVYQTYLLTRFQNGKHSSVLYQKNNYNGFIAALTEVSKSTNPGGCTDIVFDAVADVFTKFVYAKSPIYIYSDALPSDSEKWRTVTEMNAQRKMPIWPFVFNFTSTCIVDPLNPNLNSLQRVAYLSGGLVQFPTSPSTIQYMAQQTMSATTYRMNLVIADDLVQCSTPTYRTFFADSSTSTMILVTVGIDLIPTVINPDWVSGIQPIFGDGYSRFYEISGPKVGEYMFTLTSATAPNLPCSYRIMARSDYDFFFATTTLLDQDASGSEPVFGQASHLVGQLNGLVRTIGDPFRLFSELMITTNDNTDMIYQKPLYFSNGKFRSDCSYHLYFGTADFCEFADQQFYATIYADDNNGFTIQRTAIGYCSATVTTLAPPDACLNGGVYNPDNNKTCICVPGFVGDHCETIVCQNGGTSKGSVCTCPAGTSGTFCELYACTEKNAQPHITPNYLSMTFIFAARASMQDPLNKVASGIIDFVKNVQSSDSSWIGEWNLLVVNENYTTIIVSTDVPNDFVNAVNDVVSNLPNYSVPDNDNCDVLLLEALQVAASRSAPLSSVYAFVDSNGKDEDYQDLYTVANEYRIQLNIIGQYGSQCFTNNQFSNSIQEIVLMTSGNTFMTTQPDMILQYIASQYKSGVASEYYADDCTTKQTYYFPTDGWTEAQTIAATGQDINLTVTMPNNNEDLYFYYLSLIEEQELRLYQYIRACPAVSWNYRNQYCYQFAGDKSGFMPSSMYCHSVKNGYLVGIHSSEDNDYIQRQTGTMSAWIGLVRSGNRWVWDVPDGNSYQELGSYTNWKPGVDPNNPQYNFVAMDGQGYWVPTDGSTNLFRVCQVHRYGRGETPNEILPSTVPPGLWKVEMQTSSGSCFAQVRAQSEIQVYFGFTQDGHNDFPDYAINKDSKTNYLVADATSLQALANDDKYPSLEGRLNYALLGYNYTLTNPLPLNDRASCSYPMVSQAFECPVPSSSQSSGMFGQLYVQFSGIDQYGYSFERLSNTICMQPDKMCFNGGFYWNGQCVCQPGYTGTQCRTPICQNGGYENGNGQCKCQIDFEGEFCHEAICDPPYPANFRTEGRTLAIALETSYNMGSTIFQLKKNLKDALNSIVNDPTTNGWFSNFILYPFDAESNRAYWYPIVITDNVDDLIAGLKTIPQMDCPGSDVTACDTYPCVKPLLAVVRDLLSMNELAKPDSVVTVITRAAPEDYTILNSISETIFNSRATINFVYSGVDSPCGQGWENPPARTINQIAKWGGGNTFAMTPLDLPKFFTSYVPTLYRSADLEVASNGNCSSTEILFQVENDMYEFTVDFYHPIFNPPMVITLTDPVGDSIDLPENIIASDTNYLGVVQVNNSGPTRAGTYRLRMTGGSSSFCNMNVRGRSALVLFPGFVQVNDANKGANNDDAYFAPIMMQDNTLVVHADQVNGFGGYLTYVQFVADQYGVVLTSQMRRRDSACSYEWHAMKTFDCSYDKVEIIIYGIDDRGAAIRRVYLSQCVGTRPKSPPPPPSCDLRQIAQDTLFVIDSSAELGEAGFTILKNFAATSQLPYQFNHDRAQVAGMMVADAAQGGFSYNAPEDSYDKVADLLKGLTYLGTSGQNLTSAIIYAQTNYDRETQGYRPSNNVLHNLVYVTGSNPTDDDPAAAVYTLKRSGLYGVSVITYNMKPSAKLLSLVSDRCIYQATDEYDLKTYGSYFLQGLSCMKVQRCGL